MNLVMNEARVPAGRAMLDGNLTIVAQTKGLVLFAHGSGSSRHSPRNQFVARTLNDAGLATLLFDLLTSEEESVDVYTREHRFDIGLLAERLVYATKWAKQQKQTKDLLNEQARAQMKCECKIEIVPGATHLFEEPGALEQVAKLASEWFLRHIARNGG